MALSDIDIQASAESKVILKTAETLIKGKLYENNI